VDKDVWNSENMSAQQSETRRTRLPLLERRRPMPATTSTMATGDAAFSIELVRNADVRARESTDPIVPRSRSEILNRAVNVVLAVIALIIAAPVMLLVAIAVKLTSRGPVLYSQTRVGLDRRQRDTDALYDRRKQDNGGQIFTIYKFRSMYVDAERDCGEVWATKDDPRVTPVGGFLRKTRLDELPQLFNVLLGDMNIVGPRPERPSIFARLRENVPEYPLRQRTRPGITGLAQINHTYDTSIDDVRTKVRYDLEYLQRQCLAEDLRIMVKTVPVMLFRKTGW
jgi:lipopolysaccharide/colanic/teichoic acid biosynthesis glycosyltransferase